MSLNGALLSRIGFDSAPLDPASRFQQYRELYSGGADAIELGPQFRVSMRGAALDRAVIYERQLVDIGHERTAARCARDDFDHFTLTLVLAGDYHADSGAGFGRVAPGQIALMDMARPMRNRALDAHVVTFSMPRARIGAVAGRRVDQLHGHVIPEESGFLLADHLRSLARHAHALRPDMMIPLSRISTDVLSTAITDDRGGRGLDRYPMAMRFDQVAAYVERHLGEPALDTAMIAARFGISRATLYRMFELHDGVARYVRRRRLIAFRARLSELGATMPLAELALATGFTSEAIASEAFKAEFGQRPGVYRNQILRETTLERARRKMREWTAQLA